MAVPGAVGVRLGPGAVVVPTVAKPETVRAVQAGLAQTVVALSVAARARIAALHRDAVLRAALAVFVDQAAAIATTGLTVCGAARAGFAAAASTVTATRVAVCTAVRRANSALRGLAHQVAARAAARRAAGAASRTPSAPGRATRRSAGPAARPATGLTPATTAAAAASSRIRPVQPRLVATAAADRRPARCHDQRTRYPSHSSYPHDTPQDPILYHEQP